MGLASTSLLREFPRDPQALSSRATQRLLDRCEFAFVEPNSVLFTDVNCHAVHGLDLHRPRADGTGKFSGTNLNLDFFRFIRHVSPSQKNFLQSSG